MLAPCHLHRISGHHPKEDPRYFGMLIAGLDLAQAVVVFVVAIAPFQLCSAPAFGLKACADAFFRAVRAVAVRGIYCVCGQFVQLPKVLAVEGNSFFEPHTFVESFEAEVFYEVQPPGLPGVYLGAKLCAIVLLPSDDCPDIRLVQADDAPGHGLVGVVIVPLLLGIDLSNCTVALHGSLIAQLPLARRKVRPPGKLERYLMILSITISHITTFLHCISRIITFPFLETFHTPFNLTIQLNVTLIFFY